MLETLIKKLDTLHPLSSEAKNEFAGICKTLTLKKGDHWLYQNKVNYQIAFVVHGYLRKYYLHDGKELTDFFYFDGSFCSDLPSILTQQASDAFAIAMKPTELICFSFQDFKDLRARYHSFESIYASIIETTFLQFHKRTSSFIKCSPKERYDQLLNTNPQILKEVNQYHIASYLGISYQHLSRLRAQK